LAVSETVIRRLIKQRVLPAKQVVESTPWIIARQDNVRLFPQFRVAPEGASGGANWPFNALALVSALAGGGHSRCAQ
jgi:hypothetical protein